MRKWIYENAEQHDFYIPAQMKSFDLLTVEEAEKLPERVREYHDWWWLNDESAINYYGEIVNDFDDFATIRPVLTVFIDENFRFEFGKIYSIYGKDWVYIDNNKFLYDDKPTEDCSPSKVEMHIRRWEKQFSTYPDFTICGEY